MVRNYMNVAYRIKWVRTVIRRNGPLFYDVLVGSNGRDMQIKLWKLDRVATEDPHNKESNQVPIMSPTWEPPENPQDRNKNEEPQKTPAPSSSTSERRYPTRDSKPTKRVNKE